MAPDDSDPDSSEYQPLSDAIGVVLQSNVSSGPSKGSPVRSVSASAESVYFSPNPDKRPKSIAVGEVVGIRGLKLSMGSGPKGSSVLYCPAAAFTSNLGRYWHSFRQQVRRCPQTKEVLPTRPTPFQRPKRRHRATSLRMVIRSPMRPTPAFHPIATSHCRSAKQN